MQVKIYKNNFVLNELFSSILGFKSKQHFKDVQTLSESSIKASNKMYLMIEYIDVWGFFKRFIG